MPPPTLFSHDRGARLAAPSRLQILAAIVLCVAGWSVGCDDSDKTSRDGTIAPVEAPRLPTRSISASAADLEGLGPMLLIENGRVVFPQPCKLEVAVQTSAVVARIYNTLGRDALSALTAAGAQTVALGAAECIPGTCDDNYVGLNLDVPGDGVLVPGRVIADSSFVSLVISREPPTLPCWDAGRVEPVSSLATERSCRTWFARVDEAAAQPEMAVQLRTEGVSVAGGGIQHVTLRWRLVENESDAWAPTEWVDLPVREASAAPVAIGLLTDGVRHRVVWRMSEGAGAPTRSAAWLTQSERYGGEALYKVGLRYDGARGQACSSEP